MDLLIAYVLGIFTALKTKFPLHKPIDGTEPKADAAQKQHNTANALPAIHQSGVANIAKDDTCQCCHHKTPRWKKILDFGTFIVTSGAFVAAAIYAYITHGQLNSMNKTFGEIETQTTIQRKVNELNRLLAQRSNNGAPLALTIKVHRLQSPDTYIGLQFFAVCKPLGKQTDPKTVPCALEDKVGKLIRRTNIVLKATYDFRNSDPQFNEVPNMVIEANKRERCENPDIQECVYDLPQKQLPLNAFTAYQTPGSDMKLYIWGRAAYVDVLGPEGYDFCKWIAFDRLPSGNEKSRGVKSWRKKKILEIATASPVTSDDKTRISAGSGLMLETLLNAVNRSPAFERVIFSRLPTDKLRSDLEAGFKIESERGLVRKDNFDDVVIG